MMNAQEIIAYIGSAEKKTPVKAYVKEKSPIDYGGATVFGEGPSKVVFGDWRTWWWRTTGATAPSRCWI